MPHALVVVARQQLPAGSVALVPSRRQNPLFQVGGVGTVQQQVLVVVRFYHDVVRRLQIAFHLRARRTAVRGEHPPLAHEINHIPHALRRVVADTEGLHLQDGSPLRFMVRRTQQRQLPARAFLEILARSLQLLPHAVVAVYPLVHKGRRVYRQAHTFTQRAHGADMVRVVMRNQHARYVAEVQTHTPQVLLYRAGRYAGIYQDALLARA